MRKELKAVLGTRTNQRLVAGPTQVLNVSMNQGLINNSSSNNNNNNNTAAGAGMMPGGQSLNQADLEAFGLSLELPQGALSLSLSDVDVVDHYVFGVCVAGHDGAKSGRQWDSPTMGGSPSQTMSSSRVGRCSFVCLLHVTTFLLSLQNTVDESPRPSSDSKMSLLQKLLSE